MTVKEAIDILENMQAEKWSLVAEAIAVLINFAKENVERVSE